MRFVAAVGLCCAFALGAQAQIQFHGFVTIRGIKADAPDSWINGGVGKFDAGNNETVALATGQLGVDWTPQRWLLVHADGVLRNDEAAGKGRTAGVVQAYIDVFNDHWRLRAGQFWLPTSRENIEPLWTSPYVITYSALNSWNAQEVRPIGADLQYSPNFYVTFGGTLIRGNDTMGTLLAARGWTLGNRLTVYDEVIPAPPATTRPFGTDLDNEYGFSARGRLQLPERAMIQFTHIDNRAKVEPGVAPEVPWHTRYNTVGGSIGATSPTTFAAEWASGDTTVGFPGGSFTLGFNTIYALISHKTGPERFTLRVERFATDAERGTAYTLAGFHDIGPHARSGIEYVHTSGTENGGKSFILELRYSF
jgi:hypothetical protein